MKNSGDTSDRGPGNNDDGLVKAGYSVKHDFGLLCGTAVDELVIIIIICARA